MPLHLRKALRLEGDELCIAAVADTHARPHPKLDARLDEIAPAHIFHAGDIGSLAVVRALERHAPVTAVRGNIDERLPDLPDIVTVDVQGVSGSLLKILLTHIAVSGPKLRADVRRLAQKEDASLVVCGHSHVPFATQEAGIAVFNPGSVGPCRFTLPIVLGVIGVRPSGVTVRHVSCETGVTWRP